MSATEVTNTLNPTRVGGLSGLFAPLPPLFAAANLRSASSFILCGAATLCSLSLKWALNDSPLILVSL